MATYVNDLRLKEIGTGESSGTWGTETNVNLELIGEALGYGTEGITTNADTHTTTVADGATDPGRAMYIKYTGTLDSACTITIGPNTINRLHYIENATSGSQNIIISQGSGANITIPAGDTKAVYLDGAGSGAAVVDVFASFSAVDLKVQDDLTVTDDATVGGTLGVTGILTCTDDIIIGDGKTIGSASDVDAMTIAANGQVTFTQTLIGTALDISGDIDVDGTANLDIVDIDGATNIAAAVTMATNNKIQFRDDAIYLQSSADGQLDLVADTEIQIAATTIDINGAINASGEIIAASLDISGNIDVDGTANLDVVDIDGAVDMASTLQVDGAITSSAGMTITVADNSDVLTIVSTDADGSSGPNITLYRNSGSPADSDNLGDIHFRGRNDNSQDVEYAVIDGRIVDASDGTEDGKLEIVTIVAGSGASRINMINTETVLNEDSIDLDFRVESDNDANAFFLQGNTGNIAMGHAAPDSILHIKDSGDTYVTLEGGAADANTGLIYHNSGGTQMGSSLFDTDDSHHTNYVSNNYSRVKGTGVEVFQDIFSDSGTGRGAGYFRFLTDGASAEQSVAQIYMEQGSGDAESRKCHMYFQVADNAAPSTAMTIFNNKNIQVASGITFGSDTATANLLDDYEEGTWSASLRGTSGSAGSHAQSTVSAYYRKVGGLCFINAHFYLTNKGSYGGSTTLVGLPFTNTGSTGQISLGSFPDSGYGTTSGNVLIAASILSGGAEVRFYEGARLDGLHSYSDVGTGYYVNIGGCYPVD